MKKLLSLLTQGVLWLLVFCLIAASIILPIAVLAGKDIWLLAVAWAVAGIPGILFIVGGTAFAKNPPSTPRRYDLLFGVTPRTYEFGNSKSAIEEYRFGKRLSAFGLCLLIILSVTSILILCQT